MRLIDADALNEHWFDIEDPSCGGECAVCSYLVTEPCQDKYGWVHDKWEHCKLIDLQPTIDPVKHGRWIINYSVIDVDKCSECGYQYSFGITYRYCPHCGAKMDLVI